MCSWEWLELELARSTRCIQKYAVVATMVIQAMATPIRKMDRRRPNSFRGPLLKRHVTYRRDVIYFLARPRFRQVRSGHILDIAGGLGDSGDLFEEH